VYSVFLVGITVTHAQYRIVKDGIAARPGFES
jgi:hypothetical protein